MTDIKAQSIEATNKKKKLVQQIDQYSKKHTVQGTNRAVQAEPDEAVAITNRK